MDDISAKLNQILSDPQSMAQVQNIVQSMGLGGQAAQPSTAQQSPSVATPASQPAVGPEMLSALTKLAPVLSKAQQEDSSTQLLHALRPLLSPARQKKVDEAVRILQILHMLPFLKESGILGSIFG